MVNERQGKEFDAVEIRATALYVPAGISPELLEYCMNDIRKYNEDRGIRTEWDSPGRRQ